MQTPVGIILPCERVFLQIEIESASSNALTLRVANDETSNPCFLDHCSPVIGSMTTHLGL